jgi:hypothetical protein
VLLVLFAAACSGSEKKSGDDFAGKSYVAYAFSGEVRSGAFAFSQVSTKAARDEAVAECGNAAGGKKCAVLGAFKSECGAVAATGGKRATLAPGPDAPTACRAAEDSCAKRGGKDCVATNYACRKGEPGNCDQLSAVIIGPGLPQSGEEQSGKSDDNSAQAASTLHIESNTYVGTQGPFGAISMVSANGRAIGYIGYDEPDKETASQLALGGCREIAGADGSGCKVDLIFHNSCAAVASTPDGGYGTGWGDSPALACRWALDACDDYNKSGCAADMYLCSPGGKSGTCDGGLELEGDKATIDNGRVVVEDGATTIHGN